MILFAAVPAWSLDYTTETIPGSTSWGSYTSLAIGQDGAIHIACLDVSNDKLYYVKGNTGSWTSELVYAGTMFTYGTALGLDSNDKAYIAFINNSTDLTVSYNSTGAFLTEVVPGAGQADYPSLVVDGTDKVHISSYEFTFDALKYASGVPHVLDR